MSMATAILPSSSSSARPRASAVAGQDGGNDWITQAEAARILNRHVHTVKAIALAGGLRYKAIPGARVRYSRADAERLAAAG